MEINALLMDPSDNVVTCVNEVAAGQQVIYRSGEETITLTALEDIPYCHKIALVDIPAGGEVIKYGESLGNSSDLRLRKRELPDRGQPGERRR